MKSKKKNSWLRRQEADIYVKQSKELGYRSRAAFKLIEIDKKYKILKNAKLVFDIGAAPGGWSQIISQRFSELDRRNCNNDRSNFIDKQSKTKNDVENVCCEVESDVQCEKLTRSEDFQEKLQKFSNKPLRKIVAVDLLEMDPLPYVEFFKADFTSNELLQKISEYTPDVILSDMAPNTTGHVATDHLRSMYLSNLVVDLVEKKMKIGGKFAIKIFEGSKEVDFVNRVRQLFEKVDMFKPKSSRSESKEIYVIGINFRGKKI